MCGHACTCTRIYAHHSAHHDCIFSRYVTLAPLGRMVVGARGCNRVKSIGYVFTGEINGLGETHSYASL